jgi:6-phosphogluconate dehydrogenase
MQIGFVGLGRMGGNMVHRLIRDGGHQVIAFDPSEQARATAAGVGAQTAGSLEELVAALTVPRAVWVMVPSGRITEETIAALVGLLSTGDVIVDGGNSRFTDTIERARKASPRGIQLVDAGTSGGIWGLEVGYCLMIGGEAEAVDRLRPIFATLAPPDGFLHVGPSGSGHYTKMVHNGIEYSLLQSYAEGFDILNSSQYELDLRAIAHLWNQGSVVRSWLLELAERAFANDPALAGVRGYVEDSGEGRWTLQQAIELSVPAPALAASLFARFDSRRGEDSFSDKIIAALRNEFGGHAVRTASGELTGVSSTPR